MTTNATVWTCRVRVEGQALRLGVLLLNGGTEEDVRKVAADEHGEQCTIDQVQAWPDGTRLENAVESAALPVTPHGVQASALGS
jgi:hypothetical protein